MKNRANIGLRARVIAAAAVFSAAAAHGEVSAQSSNELVSAFAPELMPPSVETGFRPEFIVQSGSGALEGFTLWIDLRKWAELTSPAQIAESARVFWQAYPRMYERFGAAGKSPKTVTIAFENEGYGVACAGGGRVHVHDKWLHDHPTDYDCLVHELAHIIQNGWDRKYLEHDGFVERFADCCRYIYAYDGGKYNDKGWSLQTLRTEKTLADSVRFLVWLDYTESSADRDVLLKYFDVCRNAKIPTKDWDGAWKRILEGTRYAEGGRDAAWKAYSESDFARLSSRVPKDAETGESPLLKKYDVRVRCGSSRRAPQAAPES